MTTTTRAAQQIFRVRRQYNQWVANQTLEDYALRFTAKKARRWSSGQVATTALGATAFLALEAIGGAITLNYGFVNALVAMLTVGAVIFVVGFPISYHAAKHGLDIDLLTRGAGFGYLGSTITSLIYASFTFIFFAIEAAILAMALKALFGLPVTIGYVICALAVIPIVTHGITFISKFQVGTQPLWLLLQCLALGAVVYAEIDSVADWTQYRGTESDHAGFDLLLFGAASAVLFAMIAQIGEQVDYLRFLPPKDTTAPLRWWTALIAAGPGWIFIGIVKMLFGSFLAYLAFTQGMPMALAADPTQMYQTAFSYLTNYMTQSPTPALVLAGVMVIISQMKINVTNAYAGSIAWSNFFSRLTHSHPGRVVWLVFNVAIALLLMELGIYRALENILGMFAIIAISWLGSLSADLMINKKFGLSPALLEFKRAHLYDINPVGVGSMAAASGLGLLCYLGAFGTTSQALAHFITLAVTFVMVPLIALLTGGRYYIARSPAPDCDNTDTRQCCICENHFEQEDISQCPAYRGPICSLCCSLDARCRDSCKPHGRFSNQIAQLLQRLLPRRAVTAIDSRLGHFLAILSMICLLNGALLALVYYHINPQQQAFAGLLADLLWTLFFVLMIVSGVLAWLFLLAHESRVVAQDESNRQNRLLVREIEAHRKTDRELQRAKDFAEAANQAKSRYLTGISHELRTPLQSILGYAQLLGRDNAIPAARRDAIDVIRRSGEHLADLIEGLLDISKIEAGRLDIHRDQVDLHALLAQLVQMFRLQAQAKSIVFKDNIGSGSTGNQGAPALPRFVIADEKRLRQVLINLLSNAVKYTCRGSVEFAVRYRSHVAEFTVTDTGVGIAAEDLQRVFNPFERVRKPGVPHVPGTGLGLTIVRLLAEIMGGDIAVESTPGTGSRFTLMLMLSPVAAPRIPAPVQNPVTGYAGPLRNIAVVDDEPTHRGLINDLLTPLGFGVTEACDAEACLDLLRQCPPDLFLIDVSMPGISGITLAGQLRQRGVKAPVVMISADAQERHNSLAAGDPGSDASGTHHDAYLVKPIKLQHLLDTLADLLRLTWTYDDRRPLRIDPVPVPVAGGGAIRVPNHPSFAKLRDFAEIGYRKGFKEQLALIENMQLGEPALIDRLQHLAQHIQFDKIVQLLETKP
ncbi:response regulator [Exilibacterium tricleocarpae]|uniref:histidine kinase n=1 Tax=Exilibacterium tricleocarpae TaxID=2591008 RepID=A0A545SYU3_9GAMM|nr:ATP-binding protein [Exilibacterium tricleocarpae]TQV70132.1 response regulator [Exilibacterium tricleocarpae]